MSGALAWPVSSLNWFINSNFEAFVVRLVCKNLLLVNDRIMWSGMERNAPYGQKGIHQLEPISRCSACHLVSKHS
jgi:hypothetical protein